MGRVVCVVVAAVQGEGVCDMPLPSRDPCQKCMGRRKWHKAVCEFETGEPEPPRTSVMGACTKLTS